MANVVFKRGLQSAIDAASFTAEDGVFYLTTDTNRLYIGQGNDKKLLNQTVQIIPNITQLENISTSWTTQQAKDHIFDFYYITGTGPNDPYQNILVVWDGTTWKQINPDTNTTIDPNGVGFNITANNNIGTATLTITDSNHDDYTGSFDVEGTGSVSVTANNGRLVIDGKQYSLLGKTDANLVNSTEIYLTTDGTTANASKLTLSATAGGALRFQSSASGVFFDVNNTTNSSASLSVTAPGALHLSITDSDNNSVGTTLSNLGIIVGENSTGFVPIDSTAGKTQATLYTKAEIDNLINGLNGMTYRGTLRSDGNGTITVLPSSGVHSGDVYVIAEDGLTAASNAFSGVTWNTNSPLAGAVATVTGDMVIAAGIENAQGVIPDGNVQWTYVPAGNDSLANVTYSTSATTATHTIAMVNGNNNTTFQHSLTAGTDVELSSTAVNNYTLETTINHATITTTTANAAVPSENSPTFTAVKSITVNNGHVTNIETDVFTPVTYELSGGTVVNGTRRGNNNAGANDVTATIGLVDSNANNLQGADLKFSSSSLSISQGAIASGATATNEIIVNLEWGTF